MAKKNEPATGDNNQDDEPLGESGKRALQAERERARKAEAEAKAARDELEKLKADRDASKSDLQKLADKVDKLTERAETAERNALLSDIASDYGLSKKQAARLRGKTREELEADAADLAETFGIKTSDKDDENQDGGGQDDQGSQSGRSGDQGGQDKPRPPVKDLKSGSVPNATAGGKSGEDLAAEVWKRTHGGV